MFNAAAIAQTGRLHSEGLFFVFLDFLGDPLRVTNWPYAVPTNTGDADFDAGGWQYFDNELLSVSEVSHSIDGAGTVTASLSGLPNDTDILNTLNNEANWRLRRARLWQGFANDALVIQGNIIPYYLGRMVGFSNPSITPESQEIAMQIESYISVLVPPTNLQYSQQKLFDAGDNSANVLPTLGRSPVSAPAVAAGVAQGGSAERNLNVRLL